MSKSAITRRLAHPTVMHFMCSIKSRQTSKTFSPENKWDLVMACRIPLKMALNSTFYGWDGTKDG